jgi:hypothetical protein
MREISATALEEQLSESSERGEKIININFANYDHNF